MSATRTVRFATVASAAAAALLAMALALSARPAAAAMKKCTRGNAHAEEQSGAVRVVRKEARRARGETRHENLYACWRKTGRRVLIAEEIDRGDDVITRTMVEIRDGRYVGIVEENEGGVSTGRSARVYDARAGKLLHDSSECDEVFRGDLGGVADVVFLHEGGMAFACDSLYLYASATAALETLEVPGTDVRQLATSRPSTDWRERLYWTAAGTLKSRDL